MEYFLCRALEIARLSASQLEIAQEAERTSGRGCLLPSDFQRIFKLAPLRVHYAVPGGTKRKEAEAAAHWRRCSVQLYEAGVLVGFMPPAVCLRETNVDAVHAFDVRIVQALAAGQLAFAYSDEPAPPTAASSPDDYVPVHYGGRGRLLESDWRTAAGEGYGD